MLVNGKNYKIGPRANLRDADLRGANLRGANLRDADLRDANLRDANLRDADLRGASLRDADLRDASLSGASLSGADLRDADLRGANLRDASLRGAKNIPALTAAQTLITPEGDLIGYKKLLDGSICKLAIPAAARRHNATGRKCRAEFAVVLEGEGVSAHDPHFRYVIGETVRPTKHFDPDRWNECAPGIHFYLTREEAEAH